MATCSILVNIICVFVSIMETIHPFSPQVASLYQRWLGKRLFSDKGL
jgi:acetone carboxylase gamma subunit